jgi:hypothetical protein
LLRRIAPRRNPRKHLSPSFVTMSDSRERVETASSSEERPRTRTYTDDTGLSWSVTEQRFSEYDRRSGYSLIFSCEFAVRRVRNYPSDWYTLSVHDLEALSWGV